jgi:hypothetical protein
MSERWQSQLAKLRRAELGTDLWDRVLEGPRHEAVKPRTASRSLAAAVAIVVFAAAAVLLWEVFRPFAERPVTLAGSDVVRVPPRGEAVAVFLSDGHPVFVVHQRDGLVVAVDALSPHRDWGIAQLVAWCPDKSYFVSWPDGSFFSRAGAWTGGRSAPPGLRAVAFEVLGRDDAGDPARLRLGELVPVLAQGHRGLVSLEPTFPSACGLADGDRSQILTHRIDPSRVWRSPSAAAEANSSEWMAVEGTLLVSVDGSVRLCARVDGDTCSDGARVIGLDGPGLLGKIEADPGSRYAQAHTWLVRANERAFVELALPPG